MRHKRIMALGLAMVMSLSGLSYAGVTNVQAEEYDAAVQAEADASAGTTDPQADAAEPEKQTDADIDADTQESQEEEENTAAEPDADIDADTPAPQADAAAPVEQPQADNPDGMPEPAFLWNFEDGSDLGQAALQGTAKISDDPEKNSKVLDLTGTGPGTSYMDLPSDLFADVKDGFTISMWVRPDSATGDYTKLFDASNAALGKTSNGGNNWSSPDFALAAGGNVYDVTLYVGTPNQKTDVKSKLNYSKHLSRSKWQYYTVSVNQSEFAVYMNGEKITYQDGVDGTKKMSEVLPKLFAEGYPQSLKYAALGRSFYTSDKDFIGKLDDVAFYNTAITQEQAAALYEANKVELVEKQATPVYTWDFENVQDKDAGSGATLQGSAEVVENSGKLKGSKVLSLKGGPNGSGYMDLPADMFSRLENVEEGFSLSMWVKADFEAGDYARIFTASNSELGKTKDGGNGWTSPDFALVAGGNVYDTTIYVGAPGSSTKDATKIKYKTSLARGGWQHMTVSITPSSYRVFINGTEIGYTDAQQSTKTVSEILPKLVTKEYLAGLTYNAIGRGLYTSDDDFAGLLDDIVFYKGAVGETQAAKIFAEYEGMDTSAPAGNLVVDMTQKNGAVKHGATGFLYGLGADEVPSVNLLTGLKPNINEQNAPHGLQHPSGDTLEVAKTFLEAGGDSIQIACPDIHANWPYEAESQDMAKYSEKMRKMIRDVREAGLSDKVVYVPFNEPDGQRYSGDINNNNSTQFCQDWKTMYDVIKAEDPNAKIAGTNLTQYKSGHTKTFIQFCAENDCIPDQFTWHVLQRDKIDKFSGHVKEFRQWEKQYWLDTGKAKEPCEIVINEYGDFTDTGVPGRLTSYLGVFEDEKANACLAYWHLSNNLCDIAADTNEPNATWWLYKWYGEMSGESLKMSVQGPKKSQLYGVAALDDNKKVSTVILGGRDGDVSLTLQNLTKTDAFKDAEAVKVKIEQTSYTGINGACDETDLISEQICAVDDKGNVPVVVPKAQAAAAYRVTVSQAPAGAQAAILAEGAWKQLYEAEDAKFEGGVQSVAKDRKYPCSGSGQAQGMNNPGDSVTFTANVPESGYYKFDLVYGAATGCTPNDAANNDPKNARQTLQVNAGAAKEMVLQNTSNWFMAGMHTEYIRLNQGSNTLKVEATDSVGKASLDCMYLTYIGDEKAVEAKKNCKVYEAEFSDFNILKGQTATTASTQSSIPDYSGSGYVTGLNTAVSEGGGIRFNTFVFENGMYDVTARCYAKSGGSVGFYLDNTNLTLDGKVADAAVSGGSWQDVTVRLYLQKGMNIIDLDATNADIAVDKLTVNKNDNGKSTAVIEAESWRCMVAGGTVKENAYASGGKYVTQLLASKDGSNHLTLKYNAAQDGTYKMAIYQSNKELFGNHSYNAQMVDRFVTISVNDGEPFNVFFRNTYSDESFRSKVVTLQLKEGENTIKIYNDDSRDLRNGVGGPNKCINYTPNFDKFEITHLTGAESADQSMANKDALNVAVSRAEGYKKEDYRSSGWEAMQKVLADAKKVQSNAYATQAEINAASDALRKALEELSKNIIDKAGLNAAVTRANGIREADYADKPDKWAAMKAALAAAEKVQKNPDASQTEIDKAARELSESLRQLDPDTVHKVALGVAIERAKSKIADDYRESSWNAMQEALAAAEKIQKNETATQEEVNAATDALRKALEELSKNIIDKAGLNAAVTRANEIKEEDYADKPGKWKAVKAALAAAEDVQGNKDASQTEIDAATQKLSEALRQLETDTVHKDALTAAIERAKSREEKNYRASS